MESIYQLCAPNLNIKNAQKVVTDLNNLRNSVTAKYYEQLDEENKNYLLDFLVKALPEIWEIGSSQIKFAAAAAYGDLFIRLAPFEYKTLTERVIREISFLTSGLVLQLSGVCFLSKFYSSVDFGEILNSTPFMHLFKFEDTDRIPNLVKYMKKLPIVFLQNLAEYFVQLFTFTPSNRHYAAAISILTEEEPEEFINIIKDETPPQYIGQFFSNKAPTFPHSLLDEYKTQLMEIITNPESTNLDYEMSCVTLSLFIRSEQLNLDDIEKLITREMVQNSKVISSLLKLPIKPEIIRELFTFTPSIPQEKPEEEVEASPLLGQVEEKQVSAQNPHEVNLDFGKFECPKNLIVPLMEYFSANLIFTPELVSLVGNTLDDNDPNYSDALRTLGDVARKLPSEELNRLLFKAFSIVSNNWIHSLWTLKLIGQLDFTRMSKDMTEKAFKIIEDAVMSQTDKLHITGCQTVLKIKNTLPFDQFKIFIDKFIRKLDIFNEFDFERRVSFLAKTFYVMTGGWTLSFMHIATMVSEAMSIFNFSPKVLEGIFYILAVFSSNMKNIENTMYFTRYALGVIVSQYEQFTGYKMEFPLTSPLSKAIIKNDIPLRKVDSDITQHPEHGHRQVMSTSLTALIFLSKVQWGEMPVDKSDLVLLTNFATILCPLFTDECIRLATVLLDNQSADKIAFEEFIKECIKYVRTKRQKLGIITVIEMASKRLEMNLDDFVEVDDIARDIRKFILAMKDLDFVTIRTVRNFLKKYDYLISDLQAEKICIENERYLIRTQLENNNDTPVNMPIINEHPEALDTVKRAQIDVEESEDMSIDESQDFAFDEKEFNSLTIPDSSDVRKYLPTLTPFIALKLEIPDYVLSLPIIVHTCNYSRALLPNNLLEKFLEFALRKKDGRAVLAVLRVMTFNKYYYPVEKLLTNKIFENSRYLYMILAILSMKYQTINSLPDFALDYIKSITSDDFVEFVINSTRSTRRNATALIKFDPQYFNSKLEPIEKWSSTQLKNLFWIFPLMKSKVTAIIRHILDITRNSRKKRPIALHLLAACLNDRKEKALIKTAHAEIRHFLLDEKPEFDNTCQVWILALVSIVCHRVQGDESGADDFIKMSNAVGNQSTFGGLLLLEINGQNLTNVKFISQLLYYSQNSMYLHVLQYLRRTTEGNAITLPQNLIDYIMKAKKNLSFMEAKELSLLLIQHLSKKPTREATVELFNQFVAMATTTPQSCYSTLYVPFFKSCLSLFRSSFPENKKILDLIQPCFDLQYVPLPVVDLCFSVCQKIKDVEQGLCLFPPYLRQFTSSITYNVAEQAALFSLKHVKSESPDVSVWVPICKRFFDSFYAAVSILKRQKSTVDILSSCFKNSGKKSLEMVLDAKKRPFSIFYAVLDQSDATPKELDNFINEMIKDLH
ncbi:hypothetical protein TVAG_180170 [Trichomonas vaginalis G3]|uniref:Uncharacterized protein n=1 Tax=Trichomonas vaginalis (strain ATCC PRA-98 / G3) TaxID=412133 RepID=A2EE46_TRIV3|nr:armadillo (ARM) repeat-containing protein family [Trichomonas vaginalis G3]EAY09043.1 hypothetical protein TVAG_180170 [Trichomonas vaginalis G3]KAI5503443.1 armadillo (ARM) repeat-containing protein family [Trichomonas vaginalis G3]|eukprot:XP_001321266.1 hypothetical protein [Trichomonas vaginalis G3]